MILFLHFYAIHVYKYIYNKGVILIFFKTYSPIYFLNYHFNVVSMFLFLNYLKTYFSISFSP